MSNKRRSSGRKVPEERNKEKLESLRSEVKRLRKQVGQLQKENQKLRHRDQDVQEIFDEYEEFAAENHIEDTIPRCPKCKSHHIKILPKLRENIDYYICDACSARGPIK